MGVVFDSIKKAVEEAHAAYQERVAAVLREFPLTNCPPKTGCDYSLNVLTRNIIDMVAVLKGNIVANNETNHLYEYNINNYCLYANFNDRVKEGINVLNDSHEGYNLTVSLDDVTGLCSDVFDHYDNTTTVDLLAANFFSFYSPGCNTTFACITVPLT